VESLGLGPTERQVVRMSGGIRKKKGIWENMSHMFGCIFTFFLKKTFFGMGH
jgi:hypothetical protein